MTVVLKQLPHERVVVRKRAATCLGSVAVVVSEPLLNRLAVHLLQKISEEPPPDVVRTLIQVRSASVFFSSVFFSLLLFFAFLTSLRDVYWVGNHDSKHFYVSFLSSCFFLFFFSC